MTRTSRDVSLVIRAKNEAEKTIRSVADALEHLDKAQTQVSASAGATDTKLAELKRGLTGLQGLSERMAQAMDASSSSVSRQAQALITTNNAIAQRKTRVEELTRALQMLQAESGKGFVGPSRFGAPEAVAAQIKTVKAELRSAQSEINRLSGTFDRQLTGLQQSRSALREIQSAQREAERAVVSFSSEIVNQTNALDGFQAAARRAKEASAVLARVNATTGVTRQPATEGGATFSALAAREEARALQAAANAHKLFEDRVRQGAAAMRDEESALRKLRDALNPTASLEARLATETEKLVRWQKQGKISADEQRRAVDLLNKEFEDSKRALNGAQGLDSRGRPSLFGLKPYELQNLSFQINDIFTQLASGTSLTQTLAQQGGQIFQLFPRVGSAIAAGLSSAPVIAFIAVMGTAIAAIARAAHEAERLRVLEGVLIANADGARYQTAQLSAAAHELDRYGLSAEQALATVRTFVKEGIDPTRLEQFGKAAKDMADVLGIDVSDAAKQVGEAFTGGYEAVKTLDDATNFLTATEREQIKTLYEQGRANEARIKALDIFSSRMGETARNLRGPWSDAVRSLGNAWDSLLTYLSNRTAVVAMTEALAELGDTATLVFNKLSGTLTAVDLNRTIDDAYEKIGKLNESIGATGDPFGAKQSQIDEYVQRIKDAMAELKRLEARNGVGSSDTTLTAPESQKKIDAEIAAADEKKLASAKAISDQKRLELAYQEALVDAQNKGASDEAARASAAKARQIEQLKIDKERATAAKERAAAEERAIKAVSGKIPGIEASGRANATNPNSSAVGLGQFIESTWLKLFKENFPDRAKGLSDTMILALRRDAQISKNLIEVYARENAAALKAAKLSVTEANLYLAHFLGSPDAIKVLQANPNTSVDQLLSSRAIRANKSILGGKTAGDVVKFAKRKVGDTSAAETAVEQRLDALALDRIEKQDEFNRKLDDENEKRRVSTDALNAQIGLQGEALLDEQRKQAVAEAVLQKQQEIAKINEELVRNGQQPIEFTEAQRKAVEDLAGAYFDAANAKARFEAQRNAVDKPVSDITAERDALRAQIDSLRENGLGAEADSLLPRLNDLNGKLQEAIDKAIEFYRALQPGTPAFPGTQSELDAIISKMETLKLSSREWVTVMGVGGQQIAHAFTSAAVNALDRFAQAIAAGGNAFKALWSSFRQFAADFLRQIAQMISQQTVFNMVSGLLRSLAPGLGSGGGSGNSWIGPTGVVAHTGGVVGRDTLTTRAVNPAWFANAMRYHTGGIAGLAADEVPAVLRRGEEVLTADDPRHRGNGGMGAAAPNIKIVNAIDAGDMVSQGLGTTAGEKALINVIRNNTGALRAALGA